MRGERSPIFGTAGFKGSTAWTDWRGSVSSTRSSILPKIVEVAKKRHEILRAARAMFVRHGYRGTNLQRVAERVRMGKSSLYHYFPTEQPRGGGGAD